MSSSNYQEIFPRCSISYMLSILAQYFIILFNPIHFFYQLLVFNK